VIEDEQIRGEIIEKVRGLDDVEQVEWSFLSVT
jgi:hypothetical protein